MTLKIKQMKKLFILISIILSCSVVFAQEIVSSSGETYTNSNNEISWTLGESLIVTYSSGSLVLTQGFHQTILTITAISELSSDVEIKVFPNPTHNFVNVKMGEEPKDISYSIYNIAGKLIDKNSIESKDTEINFSRYINGVYLLHLMKKTGEPIQTFKIIKK